MLGASGLRATSTKLAKSAASLRPLGADRRLLPLGAVLLAPVCVFVCVCVRVCVSE